MRYEDCAECSKIGGRLNPSEVGLLGKSKLVRSGTSAKGCQVDSKSLGKSKFVRSGTSAKGCQVDSKSGALVVTQCKSTESAKLDEVGKKSHAGGVTSGRTSCIGGEVAIGGFDMATKPTMLVWGSAPLANEARFWMLLGSPIALTEVMPARNPAKNSSLRSSKML